ncbi:P-loop containing nucleoside triphosphate hydrolase protein [Crucibulum laeve]|uniref:P-loop containing nucleoside triphosphate hydrolase protein n=1 Tax=Crucibulum laeve TaxID=68775 RepID=A0A5C3MH61_9AGAR|nr:P-loop containing nucleoside triphosphate hydrolase protein [Crucibulum laeve]
MLPSKNSPPNVAVTDDAFVNVWFGQEGDGPATEKNSKGFYGEWVESTSAKTCYPPVHAADALKRLYPNHSIVMTKDYRLNILSFPGAEVTPLEQTPLITNLIFIPLARSISPLPGILTEQVEFGVFQVSWNGNDFKVFNIVYPFGFGSMNQAFILHEGPEGPARSLLLAAGAWSDQLHDEIWVFNQGFWSKDHGLWVEVQKADWKDVILKDEFKKALQKDVYGFFASEEIYKELAIPWKRGLIMHGPPGNGKTISLKTIMKTCGAEGYSPLYVKSFQSWKGEEGAMADVFDKARQLAPCVIILEDLDSLINDRNRSFFLNQLDGLEGNNGLLIIGTTNHFDRLDPGLSTRPSRFDRKYLFDDPDRDERALYVAYWQKKLKSNKAIEFPDRLVDEVADLTDKFSFAYLKEVFVSSLVTLATYEGDNKPTFEKVLKKEIQVLRKQLDKSTETNLVANTTTTSSMDCGTSTPEEPVVWHVPERRAGSTQQPPPHRWNERARHREPGRMEDITTYYSRLGIQPVPARTFVTKPDDSSTNSSFATIARSEDSHSAWNSALPSSTGASDPAQRIFVPVNSMSQPSNDRHLYTPQNSTGGEIHRSFLGRF